MKLAMPKFTESPSRPVNQFSVILIEGRFDGYAEMAAEMAYDFTAERLKNHFRDDLDDPALVARILEVFKLDTLPFEEIYSGKSHERFKSYLKHWNRSYKQMAKLIWPDHGFGETDKLVHTLENFYYKRIMDGWLLARHCEIYGILHPKAWMFLKEDEAKTKRPKQLVLAGVSNAR